MGWLAKIPKVMKRGGWNNGEAGKNTAIRNFIEIKSSNDLLKIPTKRTWRIISQPEPVYAYKHHAYKKNLYIKQFCGFA